VTQGNEIRGNVISGKRSSGKRVFGEIFLRENGSRGNEIRGIGLWGNDNTGKRTQSLKTIHRNTRFSYELYVVLYCIREFTDLQYT
jgi:hypothetical protein